MAVIVWLEVVLTVVGVLAVFFAFVFGTLWLMNR